MNNKFGKFSGYNHNPEWSPYFLRCRDLEKAINCVRRQEQREASGYALSSDETVELLKESDIFNVLFDKELQKVSDFFRTQMQQIEKRFSDLSKGIVDTPNRNQISSLLQFCGSSPRSISKQQFHVLFKDTDSLRNYANMNYLAAREELEKYYKATSVDDTWLQEKLKYISGLPFRTQSVNYLPQLLSDIEVLYAEKFTNGNVHKAARQLRPRQISYATLFGGGVYLGVNAVGLMILLILWFGFQAPISDFPLFSQILLVYRALGFPLVFLWAWVLLIIGWQKVNINYVYILQLDPKSIASYLDILIIASTFTIMWTTSLSLVIASYRDLVPTWLGITKVMVTTWPVLTLYIFLFFILVPINTFYWPTRKGFLYTLVQNFIAPIGRLQFRDFLLGDFLVSVGGPLTDIGYTFCFAFSSEWINMGTYLRNFNDTSTFTTYNAQCSKIRTMYLGTTIAFVPYIIRLMQCLKKYQETHHAFPHLVNAGKYATGVVVVGLSTAHTVYYGAEATQAARTWQSSIWILYVIVKIINAVYSWIWDVTMDWGLFRKRNGCLREDLIVSWRGVYWAIIIGDAILRMFWFSQLFSYHFADDLMYDSLTVFVEIARRSVWAFFRVELEAVANYEDYRTILVVPSPKVTPREEGTIQPLAKDFIANSVRKRHKRRNSDPTSSKSNNFSVQLESENSSFRASESSGEENTGVSIPRKEFKLKPAARSLQNFF